MIGTEFLVTASDGLRGGTVNETRYQTFDNPFVSLKNWSVS